VAPRIDEAAVIPLPASGLDSRLVMVMNACAVGDLWRLPAVVAHYLAAAAGTRRVRWDGVALVRARARCSRIASHIGMLTLGSVRFGRQPRAVPMRARL
jgi:hypothetical protein